MKTKFLFLATSIVFVISAFWAFANVEAQGKKVRVWVCPGNNDAAVVARSVEAKLNSTLRFETVRDTYSTDMVVFINCMSIEGNTLKNEWVCSSTAQVVAGDIVAIPYDEADNLVLGGPDYIAAAIFERTVSRSSDGDLENARGAFRRKVLSYCKAFICTEPSK